MDDVEKAYQLWRYLKGVAERYRRERKSAAVMEAADRAAADAEARYMLAVIKA